MCRSPTRLEIHLASLHASMVATYLASLVDNATHFFSLYSSYEGQNIPKSGLFIAHMNNRKEIRNARQEK